jgi:hypothetical protein
MQLKQTLNHAISGYWDGGLKTTFFWKIDGIPQTDKKGSFVRVGSWEANHWFNVACGKTEKQTLANARRRLGYPIRRMALKCSFEYIK